MYDSFRRRLEKADSGRSTRCVYNSASAVKTSARMLTEVNECFGEKSFRVHEMLMKEVDFFDY